jgi:hypothetical protein
MFSVEVGCVWFMGGCVVELKSAEASWDGGLFVDLSELK